MKYRIEKSLPKSLKDVGTVKLGNLSPAFVARKVRLGSMSPAFPARK